VTALFQYGVSLPWPYDLAVGASVFLIVLSLAMAAWTAIGITPPRRALGHDKIEPLVEKWIDEGAAITADTRAADSAGEVDACHQRLVKWDRKVRRGLSRYHRTWLTQFANDPDEVHDADPTDRTRVHDMVQAKTNRLRLRVDQEPDEQAL
jgi:hypothetical protein